MKSRTVAWLLFGIAGSCLTPLSLCAERIPVFARKYRTSCTTCHTAAPKLNVLGEAFRLNGYRFPKNQQLLRQEAAIPLGDEAWKELWPRAIWPGELSSSPGLSLRVVSELEVRAAPTTNYSWTMRFPSDVYLLAAAPLGSGMATFVEAEWEPDAGVRVLQAKVKAQDPLPFLPERALNLWIGLQGLYPLTFADRQIDRAGISLFKWQRFSAREVRLARADGTVLPPSTSQFRLVQSQPSVELNGILGGRMTYGVGVAQGNGVAETDANNHKDVYYRLRYKLGGLRLDGHFDDTTRTPYARAGQLYDRSLALEHFAYWGEETLTGQSPNPIRALGVSARALAGPLDIGAGWTRVEYGAPWGDVRNDAAHFTSLFAKAEYIALPWLIASLKGEHFVFAESAVLRRDGYVRGAPDEDVLAPGVIALVRANVRLVAEGELYISDRRSREAGRGRPHVLWLRLDLSF